MDTKTLVIGLVALLLVIGGGVYFMNMSGPENGIDTAEPVNGELEMPPVDERFGYIERVEMVQFYEDGTHILVGEIDMPTPCDLLQHDYVVRESFPEQVHISFDVINEAEMCAQVITPTRFQITVAADEAATFSADFMGRDIELNLRPPAPGETPEDFELFFKG